MLAYIKIYASFKKKDLCLQAYLKTDFYPI